MTTKLTTRRKRKSATGFTSPVRSPCERDRHVRKSFTKRKAEPMTVAKEYSINETQPRRKEVRNLNISLRGLGSKPKGKKTRKKLNTNILSPKKKSNIIQEFKKVRKGMEDSK